MRIVLQYTVLSLIVLFLGLFLVLPVGTVIAEGVRWELLLEVFRNLIYREGLLNSLAIALTTTALVFVIALTLALLYDKYDFPGKELSNSFILVPMILPPFVGALGFQQLLGHYGIFNTLWVALGGERIDFLDGSGKFWSVCVIEALHLYPILYLNLVTSLANIDPAFVEAAKNCGAKPFDVLRRITLPLLKGGILAGASIVLIWSFTELGTPLMFGYNRTTAVQIFNGLTELETNPMPYALVAVMLLFSGILYAVSRRALRGVEGTAAKGSTASAARKLSGRSGFGVFAVFAGITFVAALPHIALILASFSERYYNTLLPEHPTLLHFRNALADPIVLPSIENSLRYSLLAMAVALIVGTLIAVATERWKLRGAWLLDIGAMLPLAVPGIVIAFGFLGMSAQYDWAHRLLDPIGNPLVLLGAAYAIRRLPYVVRAVGSGLAQTPRELEYAARNLGAGAFVTARRITMPLIAANLSVGALLAFSFSMLEVSDSLILAQKTEYYPITKAIYELSQILGSGPLIACAFGVWAMLFLAATLAAATALLGRKMGAVFRM